MVRDATCPGVWYPLGFSRFSVCVPPASIWRVVFLLFDWEGSRPRAQTVCSRESREPVSDSSWFSEGPVLGADGIGMGVHVVTLTAKWLSLFHFYFWD